nr:reverse transcriptase domain-containing protein [Tanacetum cinerariifolium]
MDRRGTGGRSGNEGRRGGRKKEEEEEEEEMDIEDEMDDPEIIYPYEIEEGELPPPPEDSDTSSDSESEIKAEDEDGDEATVGTISRASYSVPPFSGTIFMDRYLSGISTERKSEAQEHYKLKQSVSTLEDQMRGLMIDDKEEKERLKKKLRVSQQEKEQIEQAFRRVIEWIRKQFGVEIPPCMGKSWGDMKKMMLEEFYPDEEIQRMEDELRSLKLRDTNIAAYTQRFYELVILCPESVPTEKKKVEAYIKGQLATTAEGWAILRKTVGGGQLQFVMNVEKRVTPETTVRKRRTLKARKFIERGSQLFVAHVTEKEPQEKWIEYVPVIQDFPEVFPDDLSGLPPPRQVVF